MNDTQLVFVTGSGRCGTKMIKSLLAGTGIEARHEYVRNAYQREAVLYYMGRLDKDTLRGKLYNIYTSAAHYSQSHTFLDSSHKFAWCVDVLAEMYPTAKFVHLVRDGRKVASSFFYKLNLFDDDSYTKMRDWYKYADFIMPPPDEKFWHPLPPDGSDMFERICWHWVQSNLSVMDGLEEVDSDRKMTIKLEDLTTSQNEMTRFLNFIGVKYDDTFMEAMQHPKHVYVPINYELTDEQYQQFYKICGDLMQELGYIGEKIYDVKY